MATSFALLGLLAVASCMPVLAAAAATDTAAEGAIELAPLLVYPTDDRRQMLQASDSVPGYGASAAGGYGAYNSPAVGGSYGSYSSPAVGGSYGSYSSPAVGGRRMLLQANTNATTNETAILPAASPSVGVYGGYGDQNTSGAYGGYSG